MKKNESGRTILEVLAVIAVMAILLLAGMGGYSFLLQRVRRYEAVKDVTSLVTALRTSSYARRFANGEVIHVRDVIKGSATANNGEVLKLPDGEESYVMVRALKNGGFALALQAEKATCDEILKALGNFNPTRKRLAFEKETETAEDGSDIVRYKTDSDGKLVAVATDQKVALGSDMVAHIALDESAQVALDALKTAGLSEDAKGAKAVAVLRGASEKLVGSGYTIRRLDPSEIIACESNGGDTKGYAFVPVCPDQQYFCNGECRSCPCDLIEDSAGSCCLEEKLCDGLCNCPVGFIAYTESKDGKSSCSCVECAGGDTGDQGKGNSECVTRAQKLGWNTKRNANMWWNAHACDLPNHKCVECVQDSDCEIVGPVTGTADNLDNNYNPFYSKERCPGGAACEGLMCVNNRCTECLSSWKGGLERAEGECLGTWIGGKSVGKVGRTGDSKPLCESGWCVPCCGEYDANKGICNRKCADPTLVPDPMGGGTTDEEGQCTPDCAPCYDTEEGDTTDSGCEDNKSICHVDADDVDWISGQTQQAGSECVKCVDTESGKLNDLGCPTQSKPICLVIEQGQEINKGLNAIGSRCVQCTEDADCAEGETCDNYECKSPCPNEKPYAYKTQSGEYECFACQDSSSGGRADNGCDSAESTTLLCKPEKYLDAEAVELGLVNGTGGYGNTCARCLNDREGVTKDSGCSDDEFPLCPVKELKEYTTKSCAKCQDTVKRAKETDVDLGCPDDKPICYMNGQEGTNDFGNSCVKCYNSVTAHTYKKCEGEGCAALWLPSSEADAGCASDTPVCIGDYEDRNIWKGNKAGQVGTRCVVCYDNASSGGQDMGCPPDKPICKHDGAYLEGGKYLAGTMCISVPTVTCVDDHTKVEEDTGCEGKGRPLCVTTDPTTRVNDGTGTFGQLCFYCYGNESGADEGCADPSKPICGRYDKQSRRYVAVEPKGEGSQCFQCFQDSDCANMTCADVGALKVCEDHTCKCEKNPDNYCLDDNSGKYADLGCPGEKFGLNDKLCVPTDNPRGNGTGLVGTECRLCQNARTGEDDADYGCEGQTVDGVAATLCEVTVDPQKQRESGSYGAACRVCQDNVRESDWSSDRIGNLVSLDVGCNQEMPICVPNDRHSQETVVNVDGESVTVDVTTPYPYNKAEASGRYGSVCAKCYDDIVGGTDTGCTDDEPFCGNVEETEYQNYEIKSRAVLDENGNPLLDESNEPIMENVFELKTVPSGKYGIGCYQCLQNSDCHCEQEGLEPICNNHTCECRDPSETYCIDDHSGAEVDTGCESNNPNSGNHGDQNLCQSDFDKYGNGPKDDDVEDEDAAVRSGKLCFKCQNHTVQTLFVKNENGELVPVDEIPEGDYGCAQYANPYTETDGTPDANAGKWICGSEELEDGGYANKCYQCHEDAHCTSNQVCSADHTCRCPDGTYWRADVALCVECDGNNNSGTKHACSEDKPLCDMTKSEETDEEPTYTCGECPVEQAWDKDKGECVSCSEGGNLVIIDGKPRCVECDMNYVDEDDAEAVKAQGHYPCEDITEPLCDTQGEEATYTCGKCPEGQEWVNGRCQCPETKDGKKQVINPNTKPQSCTVCYDSIGSAGGIPTAPDAGCSGRKISAKRSAVDAEEQIDTPICLVDGLKDDGSNTNGTSCVECLNSSNCPLNMYCDNDHICKYCNTCEKDNSHEGKRSSQASEACGCNAGSMNHNNFKAEVDMTNGGNWCCRGCYQHNECDKDENGNDLEDYCCNQPEGLSIGNMTPQECTYRGTPGKNDDWYDEENPGAHWHRKRGENRCVKCKAGEIFDRTTGSCKKDGGCTTDADCGQCEKCNTSTQTCETTCKSDEICVPSADYTKCDVSKWCGGGQCMKVDCSVLIPMKGTVNYDHFYLPPVGDQYKMTHEAASKFCQACRVVEDRNGKKKLEFDDCASPAPKTDEKKAECEVRKNEHHLELATLSRACIKDTQYDSGHDCPNISGNQTFTAAGNTYQLSSWHVSGSGSFWLQDAVEENHALRVTYSCGNNHQDCMCYRYYPLCYEGPGDDSDCPSEKPYWNGKTCVECSGHYGANTPHPCGESKPVCSSGTCTVCGADKPYWDKAKQKCIECDGNRGDSKAKYKCPLKKPVCDLSTYTCKVCDEPLVWDDNQHKCVDTRCNGHYGSGATRACKKSNLPYCDSDGDCKACENVFADRPYFGKNNNGKLGCYHCQNNKEDYATDKGCSSTLPRCVAANQKFGNTCMACSDENAVLTGGKCVCKAGYTYSSSQKKCVPCAKGTYKTSAGNGACTACSCSTTTGTGSTNKSQCSVKQHTGCSKDSDCPGSQTCTISGCKGVCGCRSGYSYNSRTGKCESGEHTCVYSKRGVCGACGHPSGTKFRFTIERMSRHSTNVKQGRKFDCSGEGSNVGKVVNGDGCCNIYWTERY